MSDANDEDSEALRQTSDRIERLLGELRTSVAPSAWARIQELVSSLTTIYGEGLARTLEAFADGAPIPEKIRSTLCDDAVIGSLLLLHGLHPSPVEERVARAIERVRRSAGADVIGGKIESSAPDARGSMKIRISGDWRSSPLGGAGIEAALRRAIEEAAPDLASVEVERDGAFAAEKSERLVQIDLPRSRRSEVSEAAR